MRFFIKALLLISVSALFTPKLCLAVEVQLTSDTQRLQLGEAIGIYLSIVDATVESQPVIPEVAGLDIQLNGHRNSSVNMNGRRSRSVTFTYLVRPTVSGSITIPGFTVTTSSGQRVSNPMTLDVSEPAGRSSGLEAGFDSAELWEGQTAVYEVRFETLQRVLQWGWTPPDLIGFAPEQIVPESNREYELDRNGERVKVLEISTPLIAIRAGARDVSPGVVTVEIADEQKLGRRRRSMFTQTRRDVYPSEPSSISVFPLPEEGRSEDFSGLVGEFWIEASMSQETVSLGDSVTLTVRITGNGTLAGFSLPEMSDAPFQAYDQTGQIFGGVQGGDFQTTGVFQRAIVASAEGELIIPPLNLQVFSPEAGEYVEVSTGEFSLMVLPGEQVEQVQRFGGESLSGVVLQGEDILPIHSRAAQESMFVLRIKPAVAVALTPWLFLVFGTLRARIRRRTPSQRAALKAMIRGAKSGGMAEVEAAFRAAVAFEVGCTPSALTKEMLEDLPAQFKSTAARIYSEIDGARYGGEGTAPADALQLASELLEQR